jgi:hypothetical protein
MTAKTNLAARGNSPSDSDVKEEGREWQKNQSAKVDVQRHRRMLWFNSHPDVAERTMG